MAQFALSEILQLITIVSIIGGGGMVAFRLGRSSRSTDAAVGALRAVSDQHRIEITEIKNEIHKLSDVITQMAVAYERMNMMQSQINDLRGFIKPTPLPI